MKRVSELTSNTKLHVRDFYFFSSAVQFSTDKQKEKIGNGCSHFDNMLQIHFFQFLIFCVPLVETRIYVAVVKNTGVEYLFQLQVLTVCCCNVTQL